jgi:tetratricopeptide (TPR) repeat protein
VDEELRKNAKAKIAEAKNLKKIGIANEEVIKVYLQGIDFLKQIKNKKCEDVFEISDTYYTIAIIYFNSKNYAQSAEHYVQAINQLVQTELNDESYRKLTELYVDLADACYEMKNQSAGNEAMANAIKAFGLIKIKTKTEQQIGDPVKNFKKFHDFYEKQLSTPSYFTSLPLQNHSFLLGQEQRARQEEQELFQQFESISIGEIQQIDLSIEAMLSQLSISAKPLFAPIAIHAPGDEDYRSMAMSLLNAAQNHFKKNSVSNGVATYKQVINTLNSIKKPNDSDREIIKNIEQQIEYLKKKPAPVVNQPSLTVSTPYHGMQRTNVSSGIGFFGPSSTTGGGFLSSAMDEQDDYDMTLS